MQGNNIFIIEDLHRACSLCQSKLGPGCRFCASKVGIIYLIIIRVLGFFPSAIVYDKLGDKVTIRNIFIHVIYE